MQSHNQLFERLSESKFRSGFRLKGRELEYLREKGLDTILLHGRDFIETRLKPAVIENDGKQTPMRNHPFFIAQHATGMCCRKCLEKWHGVEKGKELSDDEIRYLLEVASVWLGRYL